jgi:hypothetical protein
LTHIIYTLGGLDCLDQLNPNAHVSPSHLQNSSNFRAKLNIQINIHDNNTSNSHSNL